ncbi:hypothetical protein L0F63_001513, partial [Massospora cicadina]
LTNLSSVRGYIYENQRLAEKTPRCFESVFQAAVQSNPDKACALFYNVPVLKGDWEVVERYACTFDHVTSYCVRKDAKDVEAQTSMEGNRFELRYDARYFKFQNNTLTLK